jgi:hypothetical protein
MTNTFIISWDMTGLEAVVDITQDLAAGELRDQEVLFDILKDPEANHGNEPWRKISNIIQSMTLRARANTQRHYEIYSIQTVYDIDRATLERLFEDNPQAAAELIRDRGTKLYSDRIAKRTQVIE